MVKLLVSAPGSGHGKTVLTCALLSALARRGLTPCAFKCGPDYIDPQFHRAVPGVESRNLDLFLLGGPAPEQTLQTLFQCWTAGHASAVCEGAMGLYDGLGGVSDRTSAWHVAKTLDLPVLLSLRAEGAALTLAAVLRGMRTFREGVRFAGVILNRCSPSLCRTLAPVLEQEAGLPVLGCLPPMDDAVFPSRHLGLVTPGEMEDLSSCLRTLGNALEEHVDLNRLVELCGGGADNDKAVTFTHRTEQRPVCVAVARDESFCFLYPETLEALEQQGVETAFFSPLHDAALPPGTAGLYLPGGYPELHASALAENTAMRSAVAAAVRAGLPTVAEGGGFLYLGTALRDLTGTSFPMAGVLPGEGASAGRLVRFGYAYLSAETDSLLFRAGERIPVHAFHHWDSTENGTAFRLEKPEIPGMNSLLERTEPSGTARRAWREGFAGATLYAGFLQLYFAGSPTLAARFAEAAARFAVRRNGVT